MINNRFPCQFGKFFILSIEHIFFQISVIKCFLMNWWEKAIPRNTQVWYGRVISEWILKEKSKITWLKSLLKMKTRPPGVFCGIYLPIWHGRIRDALKENLDFPWFNCWILRCLLLEKSHFLQAQHPIVKYQLTHLVSNDSNDMIIVKGDAIQPHWFCQQGLRTQTSMWMPFVRAIVKTKGNDSLFKRW